MMMAGVDDMRSKYGAIVAKLFFWVVQAVFFFPININLLKSDLELSWQYGLQLYHLNDFLFGRKEEWYSFY